MSTTRLVADLEKRLGTFQLQVRLEVGTEVLVLFGPSGGGKTTTLDLIAGLASPDAGEVVLDGTPFFRRHRAGPAVSLPARKRRVGYVFQQYALFPHLTAAENVAYALRRRPDGRRRATTLLERVRMAHLAHRYPHELSGGQQQRVAVARALAAEPRLLLLDEPFSALDAPVRERLQHDLRALQAELGLVVLYVTHRLEDAFAMGDRLAIIRDGRIEQVGPIEDVFRRPATHGAAEVMGIRNLFHACVVDSTPERLVLDWDGLQLHAPAQPLRTGERVTGYIRPEDIKILYPDRPLTGAVHHNQVTGIITESQARASLRTIRVSLPNRHKVEVRFPANSYTPLRLEAGAGVRLSLRKEGVMILHEPGPAPGGASSG